jgi:hypothetical protein
MEVCSIRLEWLDWNKHILLTKGTSHVSSVNFATKHDIICNSYKVSFINKVTSEYRQNILLKYSFSDIFNIYSKTLKVRLVMYDLQIKMQTLCIIIRTKSCRLLILVKSKVKSMILNSGWIKSTRRERATHYLQILIIEKSFLSNTRQHAYKFFLSYLKIMNIDQHIKFSSKFHNWYSIILTVTAKHDSSFHRR